MKHICAGLFSMMAVAAVDWAEKLIQEAMNFREEQKFSAVQLWTFHNLY